MLMLRRDCDIYFNDDITYLHIEGCDTFDEGWAIKFMSASGESWTIPKPRIRYIKTRLVYEEK